MNRVVLEVRPPDNSSIRRGEDINFKNGFDYTAAFHVESGGRQKKKPVHYGPLVDVKVLNEKGEVLQEDTRTLMILDTGDGNFDLILRGMTPVTSSIEDDKSKGGK